MPTSADLDLSVLPPEYRAAFEALQAQAARVTELEEITRRLEHLIAELNHALYGKKSEKLSEDDRQLAFEDLETAVAEVEAQKQAQAPEDDKKPRPNRAKGKRTSKDLPDSLPRIEEVIEPESLECPCGCGRMHKIGEDRSTRIDIIPAQYRVIETVRPKYACRVCTDGVTQAPAPAWLIEGGLPTEGAIAHVLASQVRGPSSLIPPKPDPGAQRSRHPPRHPCRLGRHCILPSEACGRPAGRELEGVHEAVHGRNHGPGAGPGARTHQDRLFLGAGQG